MPQDATRLYSLTFEVCGKPRADAVTEVDACVAEQDGSWLNGVDPFFKPCWDWRPPPEGVPPRVTMVGEPEQARRDHYVEFYVFVVYGYRGSMEGTLEVRLMVWYVQRQIVLLDVQSFSSFKTKSYRPRQF